MSDIPIGSPPVPPGRHAAPGGWYPDPTDAGQERYWDGWQWSRTTRAPETPAGAAGANGAVAQPPQTPQPPQARGLYGPGAFPQDGQAGPQHGSYQQGPYQQGQQPQGQQPQGQDSSAPQQPYAQGGFSQGQYPEGGYPQGQYGPGPYPQGGYGPGGYPQDGYPQGQYPQGGYQQGYPQGPGGLQNQPGAKQVATADGVRLAGWWWRALAVVIDSVIVALIAAIPSFPIYGRLFDAIAIFWRQALRAAEAGLPAPPAPSGTALLSFADQALLSLIGVLVALAYHIIFLRTKSATPGKLVCGLRVVPVDQGRFAGQLGWQTILIRVAIWVLPKANGILYIFRIVDALFPLWQPKRQALHDMAAKTQVVKIR